MSWFRRPPVEEVAPAPAPQRREAPREAREELGVEANATLSYNLQKGLDVAGTDLSSAARLAVVSRSPLTGTVSDCSAGGRFAYRLKGAGFDALRIVGKSPRPVALAVTPEGAEFLPADGLWGRTVGETVSALSGRGSVAAIGPAGENGVLFASIMMGEGNAVGRGGLGAVMGANFYLLRWIAGFLRPYKWRAVGLAVLALATTVLNLAPPYIQGTLIDKVLTAHRSAGGIARGERPEVVPDAEGGDDPDRSGGRAAP